MLYWYDNIIIKQAYFLKFHCFILFFLIFSYFTTTILIILRKMVIVETSLKKGIKKKNIED